MKKTTKIFWIIMIIFLPVSYYLVNNGVLPLYVRNITFGVIIGGHILVNMFIEDKNKKNRII